MASDNSKRHATQAQVEVLMDFMHDHADAAKGLYNSGLKKEELEALWDEITTSLNTMGGAVKSVKKWKQTWRDLKANSKKRSLSQPEPCDTSVEPGTDTSQDDEEVPLKKKIASFDEEILKIERDKLELDRDYKAKKIEVMSRIASALERLAKKK